MSSFQLTPVKVGDTVTLRKAHPCGGYDWTVTRVGADIGLVCHTCGRRIMLTRREFERHLKAHHPAAAPTSSNL
ncbi:MAG: DUF951 domain-containing protein [Thermoflexales bacterium]